MLSKPLPNERQHIQCRLVRLEVHRLRIVETALGRSTVFLVEIPYAAFRPAIRHHQQPRFSTHVAIEKFHYKFIARLRPGLKLENIADEAIVDHHVDRKAETLSPAINHRLNPPFARLNNANKSGVVAIDRTSNLAREAATIVRIIKVNIIDGPACRLQLSSKVAHCRKNQSDLALMVKDIRRLIIEFHHQHNCIRWFDIAQRRQAMAELIAQNGYENFHTD